MNDETRTLNVENLTRLRDTILAVPDQFDMEHWARDASGNSTTRDQLLAHNCGTAACIGGWASVIFFQESADPDPVMVSEYEVAEVLGIEDWQADQMFFPARRTPDGNCPYQTTNVQAARVIDHLIETGEVDWEVAFA